MAKHRKSRKSKSHLGDTYNEQPGGKICFLDDKTREQRCFKPKAKRPLPAHAETVLYKNRHVRLNCKRIRIGKSTCTQALCDTGDKSVTFKNSKTGKLVKRHVNHAWRIMPGTSSCSRSPRMEHADDAKRGKKRGKRRGKK